MEVRAQGKNFDEITGTWLNPVMIKIYRIIGRHGRASYEDKHN